VSSISAWKSIDPKTHVAHELHRTERTWNETNCYADLWIEVLNALDLDPLACMPFTLAIDFEDDQFTFYKPSHDDLYRLYGLDVQELTVWRPILQHLPEQLRGGKLVLTESDAFFLPDTSGTDYQTKHSKTTIAVQEIDVDGEWLRYFHNGGYYELSGKDFRGLFRLDVGDDPGFLPLFAELVRLRDLKNLDEAELTRVSLELLRKHLARRPKENPITRFRKRFDSDLEQLKTEGLPAYHLYAFASIRQLGSGFDIAAYYLRWLEKRGEHDLEPIAREFDVISSSAKSLILKGARAVNSKKAADLSSLTQSIETAWDTGMTALVSRYER
jgi:hypothetical protein